MIQDLASLLDRERVRIIVEDAAGGRWSIVGVFAIGAETDDPGVVVKIEPEY